MATDVKELMAKVGKIRILTNKLIDDQLAGDYHSTFKGQGVEFDEVRPYMVGDDVRTIDWNVTAKTGMPFEFVARDAMMYYYVSVDRRGMSFIDLWNIYFVNTPSVSDSGYLFYLTLLAKITGESIIIPRLIHSVLSAFSVVQVYTLAKRNIGDEGARIAGIFACLFPNLIYHCGLHMKETVMQRRE